jgi:peptidylprolyl isomerase
LARKGQKRKNRSNRSVYQGGSSRKRTNNKNKAIVIGVVGIFLLSTVGYFIFGRGSHAGSGGSSSGGVVGQEVTTPSGLKYVDEVIGTGPSPRSGQNVSVNYVGTLENGSKFDSSYDKNQPFSFPIGQGRVIKGWDEGVMTMKVGGKRKLIVPPDLGYGARSPTPKIPPNSTLIFEVELLGVN